MSDEERMSRVVEANVYFQIVRDLCGELYNIDFVHDKCRTDYLSIMSRFEQIDNRSRNGSGKENFAKKQDIVAEITDKTDHVVRECLEGFMSLLSDYVVPEKLLFASLIGMISGVCDCIQQIYLYIRGKMSTEIKMVNVYIKHTENTIKIEGTGHGNPDFNKVNDNMVAMFKTIGLECAAYVKESFEEAKKKTI